MTLIDSVHKLLFFIRIFSMFSNIKSLLSLSNCIKIGVLGMYTIKNDIQEKQAKNTMHMHNKSNTLCCSIVDLLYGIKYSNCAPYRILFCSNKQRHIYGAIIHRVIYLHEQIVQCIFSKKPFFFDLRFLSQEPIN